MIPRLKSRDEERLSIKTKIKAIAESAPLVTEGKVQQHAPHPPTCLSEFAAVIASAILSSINYVGGGGIEGAGEGRVPFSNRRLKIHFS